MGIFGDEEAGLTLRIEYQYGEEEEGATTEHVESNVGFALSEYWSWTEDVKEGSAYFSQGKCPISLNIRIQTPEYY